MATQLYEVYIRFQDGSNITTALNAVSSFEAERLAKRQYHNVIGASAKLKK